MKNRDFTRRSFVKRSFALAAPTVLAANAIPLTAAEAESGAARKLKVVCVGGHPDDPESGCAGTLLRYAELGHSVTIIYLTRGERGIRDKSLEEAAQIRTAESEVAAKIIGAKAVFAGQIDGATEMNRARLDQFSKLLAAENPDIIFTHWPIDTHMDHQVASDLAYRAYLSLPGHPQLYFFEVNTGSQSQGFKPDVYVDITSVVEKKKAALFASRITSAPGCPNI